MIRGTTKMRSQWSCLVFLIYAMNMGTAEKTGITHPTKHYTTVERGSLYTKQYRMYFKEGNKIISPWHDVPLYHDEHKNYVNMICEIPRWTNAKMETSTKELLNPIKQDIKNETLRFVDNVFPYKGYICNYGALPQTWENKDHEDPDTKAKGDNDPIDICEIGSRVAKRGDIYPVKILGIIGLIDDKETDWKLIGISVGDPLEKQLTDLDDIEKYMRGLLEGTRNWFRIYKIPSGKPANTFAFNGEYKNTPFAHKIIQETHQFWKNLVEKGGPKDLIIDSAEYTGALKRISQENAKNEVDSKPEPGPPAQIDPEVDQWHFVTEPINIEKKTGEHVAKSHIEKHAKI